MHTHIWIFDLIYMDQIVAVYILSFGDRDARLLENNIYFFPSVIQAGNIDALPLPRDAS
jgi:hypothetical protein